MRSQAGLGKFWRTCPIDLSTRVLVLYHAAYQLPGSAAYDAGHTFRRRLI